MDSDTLIGLAMVVAAYAGYYKTFEKAGEAGWKGLVPFYSFWIQLKIVDRPDYWMGLYFVPFAYLYVVIRSTWDLGTCFGRGAWFKLGLLFMPFVFYPILGFGGSAYRRRVPAQPASPSASPPSAPPAASLQAIELTPESHAKQDAPSPPAA